MGYVAGLSGSPGKVELEFPMLPVMLSLLVACGGEEKKVEAPKAAEPPKVEAAAPPAPPPEAAAAPPAPTGPYAPSDLAKAAYDKAAAAGSTADQNPKAGDAAAIAAGKTQWAKCTACHGETGMGDGVAGAALPQKPANFHDKERWAATSAGTKHWVVLNGIQGTAMAPLGLTPDQAWEVLAYIEAEFVGK